MEASGEFGGEIVVLTGSSGCLGHQTLRLLITHDDRVGEIRCLDLVEPQASMKETIEQDLKSISRQKLIKYIKGDIRDINCVERVLDGADCIIHCAAKVDIWTTSSEQDEDQLESINVQGTETLLKSACRLGVAKFIHVSSFEAFTSYHTIYYATEATLPEPKELLFGPSGHSKREAELKVRQYANNKIKLKTNGVDASKLDKKDFLNAIIVRFTPMYGEYDRYYVSKILELTKRLFKGRLQRLTNVWIRQQPIYVGNAAWALVKAKQRMDKDDSISGEDFNITDETNIGDPFDFLEPFAECRGMKVSKSTYPAIPIWFLLILFAWMRKILSSIDIFGWFNAKKTRLQMAIEQDQAAASSSRSGGDGDGDSRSSPSCNVKRPLRWYKQITPEIFFFFVNSLFLNRTKASLRLDYEPLFDREKSMERSLNWYKNHLKL